MKLATQTNGVRLRLGEMRGIRLLCETGFDSLDYSMFHLRRMGEDNSVINSAQYREHAKGLKNLCGSYGVTFAQSHAPFPSQRVKDSLFYEKMMEVLKRSI